MVECKQIIHHSLASIRPSVFVILKFLLDAVADNVEFGGNDAVYDAAKFYVDTVHLLEKKDNLFKYSIMLEIFVVRLCVTLQLLQTLIQ